MSNTDRAFLGFSRCAGGGGLGGALGAGAEATSGGVLGRDGHSKVPFNGLL